MTEKYLTIVLLDSIRVAAFKNTNKEGKQPDYKGNGVAVWVNEKREQPKVTTEDV